MSRRDKGVVHMDNLFNSKRLLAKRVSLRKVMTPQEIVLWSRIRRKQLGHKFRRQHAIGNYVVDFYCPEKKFIIELDGWQHKRLKDKKYDIDRTKYLEGIGLTVLRFWNNEINDNLERVIMKINEHLETPLSSSFKKDDDISP